MTKEQKSQEEPKREDGSERADRRASKGASPPENSGIANGPPVVKRSEEPGRSPLDLRNRAEIRIAKGNILSQLGFVLCRVHAVVPDEESPIVRWAGVIMDRGQALADEAEQFKLRKDRLAPQQPFRGLEDLDEGKLDFL